MVISEEFVISIPDPALPETRFFWLVPKDTPVALITRMPPLALEIAASPMPSTPT
jgi:hypothetical protein